MGNLDKIMKLYALFASVSLLAAAEPDSALLKEQVAEGLKAIPGWCTREKSDSFIDLILQTKPHIWVEIGVFGGSTLFPAASALQALGEGIAIAIDPWDKIEALRHLDPARNPEDWRWWSRVNLREIEHSFRQMLEERGLQNTVAVLKMTSKDAASKIRKIDILYIDGNLSEEGVLEDVRLYLPKIVPGGYIWLNDALWTSRQAAQDLLLQSCRFIRSIDGGNCLLFQKRNP